MSKWYAAANEASFKPVPGGYIFQWPAFMGGDRNRLVNEAQKVEIMAILQRWRLLMMIFAALAVPLMAGLAVGLIAAEHAGSWRPSPGQVVAEVVTLVVLVGVVFVVVAIAYPRRKLRPLLAALPTTEERITYREQTEAIARNLPTAMLGVGLGFGVLITLFNAISAVYEHRLFPHAFGLAFGAVFIAYFVWLIVLHKPMNGNAA
jgi:MFS family permease